MAIKSLVRSPFLLRSIQTAATRTSLRQGNLNIRWDFKSPDIFQARKWISLLLSGCLTTGTDGRTRFHPTMIQTPNFL